MLRRTISLSLFLLLMMAVVSNAQNGAKLIDYNAKSAGRAGTAMGFFDSPELMVTNPAGLAFTEGSMLDANFSLMMPTLHYKNALNDKDGDNNLYPLPSIAYSNRTKGSAWSWGLGFFTTGGMGADFTLNHPLLGEKEYHSMLAVMQGGPSIAYEIAPGIAIGASAHLAYGMMEFKSPYSLSPSIMKGVANPLTGMTFGDMFAAPPDQGGFGYSEVTAAADMTELAALSFQGKLGLAFDLGSGATFGVSYSSPMPMTFKNGKATMDMGAQFNDAFGKAVQGYMMQNPTATQEQAMQAIGQMFAQLGIDPSLGFEAAYDIEATFGMPQTMGAGLRYELSKDFRLGLDVEYVFWSTAFDQMELSMTNGSNANINRMMGGDAVATDFPMNWDDSFLAKLAFEYDASKMVTLRAGYAYGSNPVPDETVIPTFPAILEHHLSLGSSIYLPGSPIAVHLAFEYGLNNAQDAAAVHTVASEYNSSTSELSTILLHLALTWTF